MKFHNIRASVVLAGTGAWHTSMMPRFLEDLEDGLATRLFRLSEADGLKRPDTANGTTLVGLESQQRRALIDTEAARKI